MQMLSACADHLCISRRRTGVYNTIIPPDWDMIALCGGGEGRLGRGNAEDAGCSAPSNHQRAYHTGITIPHSPPSPPSHHPYLHTAIRSAHTHTHALRTHARGPHTRTHTPNSHLSDFAPMLGLVLVARTHTHAVNMIIWKL